MPSNGNGSEFSEYWDPESGENLARPIELPPEKYDPRCHTCTSKYRRAIERLSIMPNVGWTDLQDMFDIDRRSIAKHCKEHLNYEEAAIRRLIEHEAEQIEASTEEGVKGALARRVFLNIYIQKTTEALINGSLELSGKDAMAAIQMLDTTDLRTEGTALDTYKLQFSAYMQAMREICSQDQWNAIITRTQQLIDNPDAPPQLSA